MKAKMRPEPQNFSQVQKELMGRFCQQQIVKSINMAQAIMFIAMNNALGIGKDRFVKVLDEYENLTQEFNKYPNEGELEAVLVQRLKDMGLEIGEGLSIIKVEK